MTMQSGVYPYNYGTSLPAIGQGGSFASSGVLFERSHFALGAEFRKFGVNNNAVPVKDYDNVGVLRTHEPRGDVSSLSGQVCINNFTDLRQKIFSLFSAYNNDSVWTLNEFLQSWFYFLNKKQSAIYIDNAYLTGALRADSSSPSTITSADVSILGGSGVFFDIDVSEVLFQPFPHISEGSDTLFFGSNALSRSAKLGQVDWTSPEVYISNVYAIFVTPVWPPCQKSNGSLVFTGGSQNIQDSRDLLTNLAFLGSGLIRVDGNFLLPETIYTLDTGDHFSGTLSYSKINDFTFNANGLRQYLNKNIGPGNRVYLQPTSQATGKYRFIAANEFSAYTPVPSGLPSQWPRTIDSFITTDDDYLRRYEVFNSSFWITDFDLGYSTELDIVIPSGLTLLSPFSMEKIWHRVAEPGVTPNTVLTTNIGPVTDVVGVPWGLQIGLFRSGSNAIYRAARSADSTFVTSVSYDKVLRIVKYDDLLNKISDIDFAWNEPESNTQVITDMCYDAVNGYVLINNSAGNAVGTDGIFWVKTDLTFGSYTNHVLIKSTGGSDHGKYKGFFDNNGKWFIYDMVHYKPPGYTGGVEERFFTGFSGIVETSSDFSTSLVSCGDAFNQETGRPVKGINGAPFVGNRRFGRILDVKYIAGDAIITAGVWAIVTWGATAASQQAYLVRIEEGPTPSVSDVLNHPETTAWEIKEFYGLGIFGHADNNTALVPGDIRGIINMHAAKFIYI